jgi:hypothetical protein
MIRIVLTMILPRPRWHQNTVKRGLRPGLLADASGSI